MCILYLYLYIHIYVSILAQDQEAPSLNAFESKRIQNSAMEASKLLDVVLSAMQLFKDASGDKQNALDRNSEQPWWHNGYDLHAWKEWGEKKARIASEVCKKNGQLKDEVNKLQSRIRELETVSGDRNAGIDCLHAKDPWSGLRFGSEYTAFDKCSVEAPVSDPWANYIGISSLFDAGCSSDYPVRLNADAGESLQKHELCGLVLSKLPDKPVV